MKMNTSEFRWILERAISGDKKAVEAILLLYMPLINKHSYINGILDEDLKQTILLHIIRNISNFKIR